VTLEELRQALEETATPEGVDWVRETEAAVAADPTAVRARFPAAGRKAGRGTLDPDADHDDVHAWTVDDAATASVMTAFYRRLRQGQGKATALREAGPAPRRL